MSLEKRITELEKIKIEKTASRAAEFLTGILSQLESSERSQLFALWDRYEFPESGKLSDMIEAMTKADRELNNKFLQLGIDRIKQR